ncbi:MAG: DEAD/DEAH box helicase [Bradymonadales bacterium]|nr:DEAD/DEAH box helicase [Bradymonadales bacterium]
MASESTPTFRDLPLSEPLLQALSDAGFQQPTDVQAEVIPLVLAGIDLIVQSRTGSGKTTACAIALNEMLDTRPEMVQAVLVTPTRELAIQVSHELELLGGNRRQISVVTAFGGAPMADQIKRIQTAQVIVATPGRLLELIRRKAVDLSGLRMFILDEADEILSMGFAKEIEGIVEALPSDRQSLILSATLSESLREAAGRIVIFPELVSFAGEVTGGEEAQHHYFMVSGVGRLKDLMRAIEAENPERALIFCNAREDTFHVANYLKREGYSAEILNGDLPQPDREQVVQQAQQGELRWVATTDLAARGLDLTSFSCVINYFLPDTPETYLQRVAPVKRWGSRGLVVSLVSPKEIGTFYQLRRACRFDLVAQNLPSDEELIRLKEQRALDQILAGLDECQDLEYGRYLSFAQGFVELPDWRTRLAKLMASFLRQKSDRKKRPEPDERPSPPPPDTEPAQEKASAPRGTDRPKARLEPAEKVETGPTEQFEERKAAARQEESTATARSQERKATGRQEEPTPPRRGERKGARRGRESSRNETSRPQGGEAQHREPRQPASGRDGLDGEPPQASEGGNRMGVAFRWIRLNLAREQVDNPDLLRQFVAELSGMEVSDLGEVQIFDEYVRIEVREEYADDIINAINGQTIGEHRLYARR